VVEIKGFCGKGDAMVVFFPLPRFFKFHLGSQTKGLENGFKSLE
jgi:hypothetical protein